MTTLEERVSALEAFTGTEARVQAGIERGLSRVEREVQALDHTMRAFGIKQELLGEQVQALAERVTEIDTWRASVDARLVTIIDLLQARS